MYNLTTIIKRLEAATSRLEDLATITPPGSEDALAPTTPAAGSRVALPTLAATGNASAAPPPPAAEPLPQSVEEFDEIIGSEVANYVALSEEIGGLIAEQAKAVEKCFAEQRKFLIITTKAKKPETSSELFMDLLSGMQVEMTKVSNIRENNRAHPLLNHLSTVSEGIPGLAWVTYDPKPAKFVVEMIAAAKFYGDRVLREYKEKDPKHFAWVKSFLAILSALEKYVIKHHNMGVTWNANGIDAADALNESRNASPGSAMPSIPGGSPSSGPPPPPPPPPPPLPPALSLDGASTPKPAAPDMGSVFEELNRGTSVTAGLKKVNKGQMTHKNPELKAKSPTPLSKPAHLTKKKPPKIELQGNQWIIENFENDQNVALDNTELHQSISIFRCKNTTIQIKGKVNTISINECVKTNVVADSLVSGIDLIKCNSFAVEVLKMIPNVRVSQCDGGAIYVSRDSLDVQVFTSKTSAVNVYIQGEHDNSDSAEWSLPEQLKHTIKDRQLVTEIVKHTG